LSATPELSLKPFPYRGNDIMHAIRLPPSAIQPQVAQVSEDSMSKFIAPVFAALLASLAVSAGAASRPSALESIKNRSDGSMEVAVTSWLIRPDGSQRSSVDLKQKLEEAASYACKGRSYEIQTGDSTELVNPKRGGLKARLSGIVRCDEAAPENPTESKSRRGSL
jgi:hypothetical protein